MTCIDKLRELRPEWSEEKISYIVSRQCPDLHMDIPAYSNCNPPDTCQLCWEREAPEDSDNNHKFDGMLSGETMRRLIRLRDRLDKDPEDVIQAALLLYEDALNAVDTASNRWVEMHIVGKEE